MVETWQRTNFETAATKLRMAKDPAFLFYPGDYLRDTQCMSEATQAAYGKIMCEHMRNICVSQAQLNFFTKELNADQKVELLMVMVKVPEGITLPTGEKIDGFQIEWVAESIKKRKAYSESRRNNRKKKPKEDIKKISETYDKHMVNENENENVSTNENENSAKDQFSTFEHLTEKYFLENQVLVNSKSRTAIYEIGQKIKVKNQSSSLSEIFNKFKSMHSNLEKDEKWWSTKRNDIVFLNDHFEDAYGKAFENKTKSGKIKSTVSEPKKKAS